MRRNRRICSLCILICLLGGCQKAETKQEGKVSEPASGQNIETKTTARKEQENQSSEEKSPEAEVVLSKEPLNMIDDNYRTYYEIYVGSFYDSDGDGIGDLKGIISKLDYLNDNKEETDTDLGINGIWLMPIMPSHSYHKYDVDDYYNVDPQYGTIEDFKNLTQECDKRGIKVIIDFVLNHTSNHHPWFVEATDYLKGLKPEEEIDYAACPSAEYYNFSRDAADRGGWHQAGETDWYYESRFADTMPDLNLDCDYVRESIKKAAAYWIELGAGGFRLDAAKEYYTGNVKKNVEFLDWFQTYVKSVDPDCYVIAEVWDTIGAISQYYESGVDSMFNFYYGSPEGKIANLVNQCGKGRAGRSLAKGMKSMQETLIARNPSYIDASFLSNHDNDRCINYVGRDLNKMKLMAGVNLCMNGSSFIYYGEEIGTSGSGKDENKRGPMEWSAKERTGITKGPDAMDQDCTNLGPVDEQLKDRQSLLNYYVRAIRLRNENPEIARGKIEIIDGIQDGDVCGITKTYQDSAITLFYNMSDEEKVLDLSQLNVNYERVKGALMADDRVPLLQNTTLSLPPYSIVVLK